MTFNLFQRQYFNFKCGIGRRGFFPNCRAPDRVTVIEQIGTANARSRTLLRSGGSDADCRLSTEGARVVVPGALSYDVLISCGCFRMTGNSAVRGPFPVMVKQAHDSNCHFQYRRHLWWLPYVRAPGRIAGERHGVTVVRRHDEQRLVELVGHHIHCCLDKPGLPNLSDCA